jgi:hypothetical protein
MKFITLKKRHGISEKKYTDLCIQFENLIAALEKREIFPSVVSAVNNEIEDLNTFSGSDKDFTKRLKKNQNKIIQLLEKEMKLVPINYYRNIWLPLGMAAFGIPIGVVFGSVNGNMGLLGIGIPIGLAIGIGIGTSMDKKALKEGRQLEVEIKN